MTTVAGPMWPLYALGVVCCLFGFGFGVCAAWGTGPPAGGSPAAGPAAAPRPPLPRAGRFTLLEDRPVHPPDPPPDLWETVPQVLLSEHYAIIDATGREADQLDAAWRARWLT